MNEGGDDVVLHRLAREVGEALADRGYRIALAESCTGGLILKLLTDVPGSSGYVEGGVVAYSDAVKRELLGVEEGIMAEHGAVSGPTARAMAEGMAKLLDCPVALSVTGIAGPGGAVPGKPVGTVWFGVVAPSLSRVEEALFPGDRDAVRRDAAEHGLRLLLEAIRKGTEEGPDGPNPAPSGG